ncbi:rod shape-determining protein [Haloplasma contractile]|uniref:Cell shape-determining protein MreB n=1 Tax=Haloplasma contractile SSD-17B TaxID=1033810 RepID=U2DRC9_9MOLU|nr:rod shape-determining protein [Haloplasma contractile]ERJ11132.1 Mbl protein [Haloplasma contractile SSD-17B]
MAGKGVKIGVDLGTVNTLVYINGQGVIYNEPSVIAFDRKTKKCIAVGKEAKDMVGKEHDHIDVIKPLEGGVISDLEATKAYLQYVFEKLEHINVKFKKSTLLICCPSEVTNIEKNAMGQLATQVGIRDVFIEEEIKAGAIGAGIDIFAPQGAMIIDIGGGTSDIGVLALGDLVVSESTRIAGNYLDNQITKYVKMKYNMAIGNKTAETIKIKLGTLKETLEEEKEYAFSGRNLKTGLPCKMTVKQSEIRDIFLRAFETITNTAKKVLQQSPPELAADIFNDGIIINGGGALIEGVQAYFENQLNLKIKIAENPLTAIVEGSKLLLKNRGNYLVKPADV